MIDRLILFLLLFGLELQKSWCTSLATLERAGTFVWSYRVFVSNWLKPTVPTHSCQRYKPSFIISHPTAQDFKRQVLDSTDNLYLSASEILFLKLTVFLL